MTQTTWDPSTNNGLVLSNNNLTATGAGSNGGIVGDYATTAITPGNKIYFEVGTDGFYAGSGFTVGVANHGWDWNTDANDNGVLDRTDPAPSSANDLTVHWDGIVDEGGSWVSNPHRMSASMQNGGTIDFAVDRAANKLWWRSSLTNQWDESPTDNPATNTGGIDISALGNSPFYPVVTDWTGAGAAATINGGTTAFRDAVPAGFTALDGSGGSSSSPPPVTTPPVTSSSTVTLGSGSDTLALQISEDAWNGDAQFTISVDGTQIGGTQTATASHAAGQTQTVDVLGNFAAGNHTVSVNFLNDAYGGSSDTDRNLYVTGATIDGTAIPGAALTEVSQGPQSFTFLAPGAAGSGASGSGATTNSATVDHPANLTAALQSITGTETDSSQPVFLDWRNYGTPTLSSPDWVQSSVDASGHFSADVNIDHAGVQGTMFYRIGSGPAIPAWSDTPS